MAQQQEFGSAQGIAEFFGKTKKKEAKAVPEKVDTSWHDAMVKQANEAYAKKASERKVSKVPDAQVKSKAPQKQQPRKRVIGKR